MIIEQENAGVVLNSLEFRGLHCMKYPALAQGGDLFKNSALLLPAADRQGGVCLTSPFQYFELTYFGLCAHKQYTGFKMIYHFGCFLYMSFCMS